MAEYIEREKLLNELQEEIDFETTMYTKEQNEYFNRGLKCAVRDVKNQPTADVVKVVRCEKCKYCEVVYPLKEIGEEPIKGYYCKLYNSYKKQTDFCSYGERKESEVTE